MRKSIAIALLAEYVEEKNSNLDGVEDRSLTVHFIT